MNLKRTKITNFSTLSKKIKRIKINLIESQIKFNQIDF